QYAIPYLVEHDILGHIFLPSGYIGKRNDWDHQLLGRRYFHLSAIQMKILHGLGWRWGSHGLTHRPLTALSDQTLKRELEESKSVIEDIIGDKVSWLSLPFGKHSIRVLEAAYIAGYTGVVIPEIPDYSYPESLNLLIPHFVYLWDSPRSLVRRLSTISTRAILRQWIDRAVRLANWGTYWWGLIRIKRPNLPFYI
ncbi:MAG: polysaccharide deacetylase family protein, partial [bacterium]